MKIQDFESGLEKKGMYNNTILIKKNKKIRIFNGMKYNIPSLKSRVRNIKL